MEGKRERRRCTSLVSDGSRRCKKSPILGGWVCASHGGSAPQVKRSARQRLDSLAEPAVVALERALEQAEKYHVHLHPSATRVAVAILDRCGMGPVSTVELRERVAEEGTALAAVLRFALLDLGLDPDEAAVKAAVRAGVAAVAEPGAATPTSLPPRPHRRAHTVAPSADGGDQPSTGTGPRLPTAEAEPEADVPDVVVL